MFQRTFNPLKNCGIRASKGLGQHFLKDSQVPERILKCIGSLQNEVVLEVGPGLGILTQEILKEPVKKLICIELDERCISHLTSAFQGVDNLTVLHADALLLVEEDLLESSQRLVVIANLPYNISTLLLLKWLSKITVFKKMVLMFQKEVGERICASPGTKQYGSLSILCQAMCNVKLLFHVPPGAFCPQPKIISSVVMLTPLTEAPQRLAVYGRLEKLCAAAFSKRRKILSNALEGLLPDGARTLTKLGLNSSKRPENLTVQEYLKLATVLMI